ncbi:hypothetical protein HAZT_HAZT008427 [Hyalella azteca]|uniref:Elongator complex protein 6 n=1 Tax=Hyalella azteca TaxID=294128 RepID=A0A6A0H5C3_HYAAZ|nr:elongator complex protein 6 [Hyalella azteca]KAA0200153.1 hypothetical protein HAZT_HAZT008427 [Hyalella azteca]
MNDSLNEALLSCGVNTTSPCTNIFVSDTPDTCGQFLTSELLCQNLLAGRRVMYVTLHNTFALNCNIAAKRSIQLMNFYKNGYIKVIEGQKLMTEAAAKALEGQDVSKHPFNFMFNSSDGSLKNLFLAIKYCVNDWRSSNESMVILIDNLSTLLSLGVSTTEIRIFIQYCYSLLYPLNSDLKTRLGNLIFVSLDDPADKEFHLIANYLSQCSDVTLSARPLSTGRTNEVDGSLHVCSSPQNKRQQEPFKKMYLYKVMERTTKLFAPGMTASVL